MGPLMFSMDPGPLCRLDGDVVDAPPALRRLRCNVGTLGAGKTERILTVAIAQKWSGPPASSAGSG